MGGISTGRIAQWVKRGVKLLPALPIRKALGTRNVHERAAGVKETSDEKISTAATRENRESCKVETEVLGSDLGNSSRFGAESEVSL